MSHDPAERAYASESEKPRPSIPRDLGGIEVVERRFVPLIDDLHQAVAALEERLVPVVKGAQPLGEAQLDSAMVQPARSPLAENLDARANGIQSAIVRLRQLEERIDL